MYISDTERLPTPKSLKINWKSDNIVNASYKYPLPSKEGSLVVRNEDGIYSYKPYTYGMFISLCSVAESDDKEFQHAYFSGALTGTYESSEPEFLDTVRELLPDEVEYNNEFKAKFLRYNNSIHNVIETRKPIPNEISSEILTALKITISDVENITEVSAERMIDESNPQLEESFEELNPSVSDAIQQLKIESTPEYNIFIPDVSHKPNEKRKH